MTAILKSAILNSTILDSTILVCPLKLTHTCQDWFPTFAQKNFTDSFWLNLMMAAILNSANLAFSHLSFPSQTHSHLPRLVPTICTKKKTSLIHSDSTWWWQPSWIAKLDSDTAILIQTPCYLLSDSLKNTLTPFWLWLKLIQSDSNSFILTQLDDGSHLEFCQVGIWHSAILVFPLKLTHTCHSDWFPLFAQKNLTHSFWLNLMMAAILNSAKLDSDTAILDSDTLLYSLRFTQKHSHSILTLTQTNSIWLKLIHSHLTWWWQPSWILPSWIWPSWFIHLSLFSQTDSQLAKIGSHHLHKKNFTHSFWLNLMMAVLNSAILVSNFSFSLSHLPRLVPTICTKKTSLIHSDSTWWWQPSWILPWLIQTPCFLLSDSLKNTLSLHSDSDSN